MKAKDAVKEYCDSCKGTGIDSQDKYSHCIPCNGRGYNIILSFKAGERQGYDKGVTDRLREIDALIQRLATEKKAGREQEKQEWLLKTDTEKTRDAFTKDIIEQTRAQAIREVVEFIHEEFGGYIPDFKGGLELKNILIDEEYGETGSMAKWKAKLEKWGIKCQK